MSLPGYAIQNYNDLPTDASNGQCYFVVGNLKWYVYDGNQNQWVESNKNDVEYFRNLTNGISEKLRPMESLVNQIPNMQNGINVLSNDYYSFKNQTNQANSPIKVLDPYGAEKTEQPIVPPKVVMQYKANPSRSIFYVIGYGNPEMIGGLPIREYGSPIEKGFQPDFIGQQWINRNNGDLWIATDFTGTYYGWRQITITPRVINPNYYDDGAG